MAMRRESFGKVISDARKRLGLSQKEAASSLYKEEGGTISPQYLNDIEHDRRNPPADHILQQLAKLLDINKDNLYFLAGQIPSDLRDTTYKPEQLQAAFKAFRRNLKGGNK